MSRSTLNNTRVFCLAHGGGPMPLLGDNKHHEMIANLKEVASRIRKPSAIVVISAHWEEDVPTVTHSAQPILFTITLAFPSRLMIFNIPP